MNLNEEITNILKEFDEKLPKMICALVWSASDGGAKIRPEQCLSYQDEPVREYEDIKFLIRSSLTDIAKKTLEGVKIDNIEVLPRKYHESDADEETMNRNIGFNSALQQIQMKGQDFLTPTSSK